MPRKVKPDDEQLIADAVGGCLVGSVSKRALAAAKERRDALRTAEMAAELRRMRAAERSAKRRMTIATRTLRRKLLEIGIYAEPTSNQIVIDDILFHVGPLTGEHDSLNRHRSDALYAAVLLPCGHRDYSKEIYDLADVGDILDGQPYQLCGQCMSLRAQTFAWPPTTTITTSNTTAADRNLTTTYLGIPSLGKSRP